MAEIEIYIIKTTGMEISKINWEVTNNYYDYEDEFYEYYYGENGFSSYILLIIKLSKKTY